MSIFSVQNDRHETWPHQSWPRKRPQAAFPGWLAGRRLQFQHHPRYSLAFRAHFGRLKPMRSSPDKARSCRDGLRGRSVPRPHQASQLSSASRGQLSGLFRSSVAGSQPTSPARCLAVFRRRRRCRRAGGGCRLPWLEGIPGLNEPHLAVRVDLFATTFGAAAMLRQPPRAAARSSPVQEQPWRAGSDRS
jgi:hypothetical protein